MENHLLVNILHHAALGIGIAGLVMAFVFVRCAAKIRRNEASHWNPLVHVLTKRVVELQEWRADAEASRNKVQQAMAFSHVLLDVAKSAYSPRALVQPMDTGSMRPSERRVARLIKPQAEPNFGKRGRRTGHAVFLLGIFGSVAACAQLLPAKPPKNYHTNESTESVGEAMDGEAISREMEERLTKVKDSADTEDVVAIEVTFFEMDQLKVGEIEAPETSVISPHDLKTFQDSLGDTATQVSYPRVLTKNRRAVVLRSVMNEPIFKTSEDGNGKERLADLPIGTAINACPVILKSGQIHCEFSLTMSSIISERFIGGQRFPVASSRIYDASLVISSGHTLCIKGLDEAGSGKSILVMVTPTRLTEQQAKTYLKNEAAPD